MTAISPAISAEVAGAETLGVVEVSAANATKPSASESEDTTPEQSEKPIREIAVGKPGEILNSYLKHSKSVEKELLALTSAITLTRFKDVTKGGSKFFHKNEGWFGKNTKSLGMDKLHHAWKTYLFTDVMQHIITNRVGDRGGAIATSAVLGIGIMSYAEILDGFTAKTGFSKEDMAVHMAGTGFPYCEALFRLCATHWISGWRSSRRAFSAICLWWSNCQNGSTYWLANWRASKHLESFSIKVAHTRSF